MMASKEAPPEMCVEALDVFSWRRTKLFTISPTHSSKQPFPLPTHSFPFFHQFYRPNLSLMRILCQFQLYKVKTLRFNTQEKMKLIGPIQNGGTLHEANLCELPVAFSILLYFHFSFKQKFLFVFHENGPHQKRIWFRCVSWAPAGLSTLRLR